MHDHDLWQRLRAGDGDACAELYRLYAERVHLHLAQRVASPDDAEDLTAEVFVLCWRKRDSIRLDPAAGMLPWLLVCANLLLRNQRRSLARAARALARVAPPGSEPDPADEVVENAADRQNLQSIRAVLDSLRPGDRDIIQLCVIRGFSPQTVAAMTGKPAGSVRSRLSRAIGRARRIYQQQDLSRRHFESRTPR